ncbi:MAG TPA: NAD-dependent epimerase/dehydratase family protein [Pyrinomonadaceae bacterium]
MRIVFIGGTGGFIGTRVIQKLAARGHEVTVFHRGETNTELPVGVREILGDRQRLAGHAMKFKRLRPDVVVDNFLRYEREAIDLMDVFRGVVERVVAISSQDVYRNFGLLLGREKSESNKLPITEDGFLRSVLYPYRDTVVHEEDPKYDYDKIPCEQVVMNDAEIAGTVLRLPATYGPGDKQHRIFPYLRRMDDGRDFILLEDAEALWRWTHGFVENVADAIVMAVEDERASNRTYNVGEPDALSRKEWVEAIGSAAGWEGEVISLPKDKLPEHLRSPVAFAHDMVVDTNRIRAELGYEEKVSREDALVATVEWERMNPPADIDPIQFDYEAEDAANPR